MQGEIVKWHNTLSTKRGKNGVITEVVELCDNGLAKRVAVLWSTGIYETCGVWQLFRTDGTALHTRAN